MRAVVAFIAGLVVVFSLGATLRAGEVPKPQGVCSGSYFQQYLEKRGVKAFAYAEDSSGRYTCGYSYRSDSGDRARTGALINCRDHATETGVTGKCQIVAKGKRAPLGRTTNGPREQPDDGAGCLELHQGPVGGEIFRGFPPKPSRQRVCTPRAQPPRCLGRSATICAGCLELHQGQDGGEIFRGTAVRLTERCWL